MRKRSYLISVYLDENEYFYMRSLCEKCGLSKTDLFRFLLKSGVLVEAPPIDYPFLIRQLRAVGNNINQMFVIARQNKFINTSELHKELNELHRIERRLHDIFSFEEWKKQWQSSS